MKYHAYIGKEGRGSSSVRVTCHEDLLAGSLSAGHYSVSSVGGFSGFSGSPSGQGRTYQNQVAAPLDKALGLSGRPIIRQTCRASAVTGCHNPRSLDLAALGQSSAIFNQMICQMAALLLHVEMEGIMSPTRSGAREAFARQLAMYLCHVIGRQTQCAVGRFFARDRKTVSHACRVIEDFRENRCFDQHLEQVEELADKILHRLAGFEESL